MTGYLYLCEWIWREPGELPGMLNPIVGLRVVEHVVEVDGGEPSKSLFAWLSPVRVGLRPLSFWARGCWAEIYPSRPCTFLKVVRHEDDS